ncbi:hypothetical protein Bbelb_336970 [Branchiostoma belcheri]|nr:hypothetical protein Bbelb_336970 [Branchiostoma belcheri]
MSTVRRRKLQWFGHLTRHNNLAKTILQGTLEATASSPRQEGLATLVLQSLPCPTDDQCRSWDYSRATYYGDKSHGVRSNVNTIGIWRPRSDSVMRSCAPRENQALQEN